MSRPSVLAAPRRSELAKERGCPVPHGETPHICTFPCVDLHLQNSLGRVWPMVTSALLNARCPDQKYVKGRSCAR